MKIIIKNTQWDKENWLDQFFWEILDQVLDFESQRPILTGSDC